MYRIIEENIVCCICVLMVRRLVTSSMTSRDYDVGLILVKSQSSKTSHSKTRTRMDYPYGQTLLAVSVSHWSDHSRYIFANLIVIGTQKVQY